MSGVWIQSPRLGVLRKSVLLLKLSDSGHLIFLPFECIDSTRCLGSHFPSQWQRRKCRSDSQRGPLVSQSCDMLVLPRSSGEKAFSPDKDVPCGARLHLLASRAALRPLPCSLSP